MLEWTIRDNVAPGYLGPYRDEFVSQLDNRYSREGWMFGWLYGDAKLDFLGACKVYEEAYFQYFVQWPLLLDYVCRNASDVYDDAQSNVHSGLDYTVQETGCTHIQDIAIRNCVVRFGMVFVGRELMQIRGRKGKSPASTALSPGEVPFHLPKFITIPTNVGDFTGRWWLPGSVEDFYQRNRRVFVRS